MAKSARFEDVKRFYVRGMWSLNRVRKAEELGWITTAEFEEITALQVIKVPGTVQANNV